LTFYYIFDKHTQITDSNKIENNITYIIHINNADFLLVPEFCSFFKNWPPKTFNSCSHRFISHRGIHPYITHINNLHIKLECGFMALKLFLNFCLDSMVIKSFIDIALKIQLAS